MTSHDAYDRLAPHYRTYAAARSAYLDAVDAYIIAHAPRCGRLLDVGSGDGVRAARIAQAIGASQVVLCEPSPRMAALCRDHSLGDVWEVPAERLPVNSERFDVITCLWNVLGHLPDPLARVAALTGMRRLLVAGGVIYCDVNNRHNARAYGRARVVLRRLVDGLVPDDRRGDSSFEWHVAGECILARGHLFTPREMGELADAAELDIAERLAIDYVTGAASRDPWDGQLLYRFAARAPINDETAQ